jgi:hypothetical protein
MPANALVAIRTKEQELSKPAEGGTATGLWWWRDVSLHAVWRFASIALGTVTYF